MARSFEGAVKDYFQRLRKPDGYCLCCRHPANRHHPVGPITVTVSEPDDGDQIWTHEFCEWRCVAHWFARQAGGDFVEVRQ